MIDLSMEICVSSPAKIHLLGEHTVVYGKPALLSAINRRLYVNLKVLKKSKKGKISINTDQRKSLIRECLKIFQKNYKLKNLPDLSITVSSSIPVGSGLGSSAALSSAVIGALSKGILNIWNPIKINELSFEVEKIQHGNPSGGDNSVVTFGGLIYFRKEFDFLKSIWSLPIINYHFPKFILLDSKRPVETTGEMVGKVADLYAKTPEKFAAVFQDQEIQTKNLLLAFKKNDIKLLKTSLKKGEQNLEKIGVVGEFAQKIIREIEKEDGAAKISGGGGFKKGSGIILCYHEKLSVIKTIAQKYSLKTLDITLAEEGIRIEKNIS